MWLRQRAARLPRIRINRRFMETPVWLEIQSVAYATGLRPTARADVICFTHHDLVFSLCQPGAGETTGQRRSKVSSERLINYLSTEPVMPELTP